MKLVSIVEKTAGILWAHISPSKKKASLPRIIKITKQKTAEKLAKSKFS